MSQDTKEDTAMKRACLLILCLLLLGLAGCSDNSSSAFGLPTKPGAETTRASAETQSSTAQTTSPETSAPAATVPASTAAPVTQAPTEASTQPQTEASTQPQTEAPTAAPTEPIDPWTLMGESLFEQGSYTDEFGYNYTYAYCLPCINADTDGAAEINVEIDAVFGAMIREAKEAMSQQLTLALSSVGYYGEVWEDVLTLVVMGHWDWSFTDYGVYCYEASTGRALDTPELLAKMGISPERFLEACKTQFRAYFEDMYKDIPADQREDYGYSMFLARVDGPEYVNLNLKVYPNANGQLVVIAPIVSMAGADYYYHPITLDLD